MADQVYKYNGSGDYYSDPVIIRDSWVQGLKDIWVNAISKSYTLQSTPWIPTYDTVTIYSPNNNGGLDKIVLPNDLEFPTKDTVQKLASMFSATTILEVPFFGQGADSSDAVKRYLVFSTKSIEAWPLANAFTNNPPDLAKRMCLALIAAA